MRAPAFAFAAVAVLALGACAERDRTDAQAEAPAATTAAAPAATMDLPAFAPLYPGARVESSVGAGDGASHGGLLTFRTADSPEQVVAFYRERAAAAGLGEGETGSAGATRTFAAGQENGERSLNVTAAPSGSETAVQLTYTRPVG